jgi:membrane complex biogenesis BtpA family protein
MAAVLDRAVREAEILQLVGMDGLLVENFMDAPFYPGPVPAETVAAMAVVTDALVRQTSVPVGVNVLRNDAHAAIAVAAAAGASFVRVNVHTGVMFADQGLLAGNAHDTLRLRKSLGAEVAILADVLVKHAVPPPGTAPEVMARDTWHRGLADGLILTGSSTGSPVSMEEIERVRDALPSGGRVWAGSGARPETAVDLLGAAHGLIVGSTLQAGGEAGGGVEESRAKAFMAVLKGSARG